MGRWGDEGDEGDGKAGEQSFSPLPLPPAPLPLLLPNAQYPIIAVAESLSPLYQHPAHFLIEYDRHVALHTF